MERMNITGWNIRRIRIEKGLTVHQLSLALPKSSPLSSEELAQMELGTRKILDYQIQAISQALGVRLSELFDTSPKKQSPKQEPQ